VPTLGGKVDLRIPPNSQGGQKLRLKRRGLPGHPPGDQLVTLKLVTPRADTAAAKQFYQRMAEELPMNPRAVLGAGRGKRGGIRVIDFLRLVGGEIVLVTLYAKNVRSMIEPRLLKLLREAFENDQTD
jgi:hypothetical protein